MKDFVDDYLTRAAIFESMDGIVTKVVQMVLPIIVSKMHVSIHTHARMCTNTRFEFGAGGGCWTDSPAV